MPRRKVAGEKPVACSERRRCRDRSGRADPRKAGLVAVERDAVAAEQPVRHSRLPLAEQLEVEVPDLLDALHPFMRVILAHDHVGQVRRCSGRRCRARRRGDAIVQVEQSLPQRRHQGVDGLDVPLRRRCRRRAELLALERTQRRGVTRDVDRLRAQPRRQHRPRDQGRACPRRTTARHRRGSRGSHVARNAGHDVHRPISR